MSDVKRYQPPFLFSTQEYGRMHQAPVGAWVSFDDYAALQARLAEVVRMIELAVELARWDLAPTLRDQLTDFATEMKGKADE